ncbi:hypothetical protein IJ472_03070 [bacterium]|nr:hypothetical protein [bacterium]
MSGISFNANVSLSVDKARFLYGVTAEDLKMLNADGDDKISIKELLAYGLGKNRALTEYFNSKTSDALLATNLQKQNDASVKINFVINMNNNGQLKVI